MRSAFSWGVRALEGLGAVSLLVLMGVVVVDVVGRNLWNSPLPWGAEVLEVALATSIFLLFPVLAVRGGHVTVDLIELPAMSRVQHLLTGLISVMLFATVAWGLGRQALRAAEFWETTPMLRLPLPYVYGALAVLAALTVLLSLVWCFRRPVSDSEAHRAAAERSSVREGI